MNIFLYVLVFQYIIHFFMIWEKNCTIFFFSVFVTEHSLAVSFRNSRPEVFYEEGVIKNFAKFTEKHTCVKGCRSATFLLNIHSKPIKIKRLSKKFSFSKNRMLRTINASKFLYYLKQTLLINIPFTNKRQSQ